MSPEALRAFFDREATLVAPALLGATLLVDGVGGLIVETEAYHPEDPASHSYRGPTPRNASMFGPPARVYVYRSYGIHWCLNMVCAHASAVLIRAIEPVSGLDRMRLRRGMENARQLCSGPGKLCEAMGVTRDLDGQSLAAEPFIFRPAPETPAISVAIGPRIGITKAVEKPWRFGVANSPFLSKKF